MRAPPTSLTLGEPPGRRTVRLLGRLGGAAALVALAAAGPARAAYTCASTERAPAARLQPAPLGVAPAPDGSLAAEVHASPPNARGQLAGAVRYASGARYGFVADPEGRGTTLFQIAGRPTGARALSERGAVVGTTLDEDGREVGFVLGEAGYERLACGALPDVAAVYPEAIEADGVVTGSWADADGALRGFVAWPDLAWPEALDDGTYRLDLEVAAGEAVFVAPPVAAGWRFATGPWNARFATVALAPEAGSVTLLAAGRAFPLRGGERFDFAAHGFAAGVAAFEVVGAGGGHRIAGQATGAVATLTFAPGGDGRFQGALVPLPLERQLADLAAAVPQAVWDGPAVDLSLTARAAFVAGDRARACSDLAGLERWLSGDCGRVDARRTQGCLAEARAIEAELGCAVRAARCEAGPAVDDELWVERGGR